MHEKNITFGSYEDEYEYLEPNKLQIRSNIFKQDEELGFWRRYDSRIHYSQKIQKPPKFIPEPLKPSQVEELNRRKLLRKSKKQQLLNKIHQRNKALRNQALAHRQHELLRKTYSFQHKHKEKQPTALSTPKSYNFPTLTQINQMPNKHKTTYKTPSPQNSNSKLICLKNGEIEQMTGNSEEMKNNSGLVGLLRMIKKNMMRKNSEFDNLSLQNCLVQSKKDTQIKFQK